eukprot:13805698-Ditylum_brightwellii.AAC.1
MFALCVDNFGVKYYNKADTGHLIQVLQKDYKIPTDLDGKNYCSLTTKWHYAAGYVDVSMPGYVPKALNKYQHPPP